MKSPADPFLRRPWLHNGSAILSATITGCGIYFLGWPIWLLAAVPWGGGLLMLMTINSFQVGRGARLVAWWRKRREAHATRVQAVAR